MTSMMACSGPMRRANARLRNENAALQDTVAALTLRQSELKAQLSAAADTADAPPNIALLPQVAAISLSGMSGLDPSPASNTPVLQLHLTAVDGRGRPIQLVGSLEAQVLRPVPDAAPQRVAATRLDPSQVQEAWRGGPLGTTWLIEVPLPQNVAHEPLLLHVQYDDLRTGRVFQFATAIRPDGSAPN
jgi:hypothetical protein